MPKLYRAMIESADGYEQCISNDFQSENEAYEYLVAYEASNPEQVKESRGVWVEEYNPLDWC